MFGLRIFGICLLASNLAAVARAAPPPQPAATGAAIDTPAALSPGNGAAIEAALTALPRRYDLNSAQRKQAEELLRLALADDQGADAEQAQWQTLRDSLGNARDEAVRIEAALAREPSAAIGQWRATLPTQASPQQLDDLLEQERAALNQSQDAMAALQVELDKQAQRPDSLRVELAQADQDANAGPAAMPTGTVTLVEAGRLRAQAAQRLARSHLAALQMEQRSYEPRLRLALAQRDLRRREVEEHHQRVAILETLLLDRAGAVVADLQAQLRQTSDELAAAPEILRDAAAVNLALGDELSATVKRLGEVRDLRDRYSVGRRDTEQAAKNIQDRLQVSAVSEAVGLILLAERRKLQPLPVLKHALGDIQGELAQARLRLIDLREQHEQLENIDAAVGESLRREDLAGANSAALHDRLYRLLASRADLLPRLTTAQTRLASLLGSTEQELGGLVATTTTLGALLDSRLLWTPSHPPIGVNWVRQSLHAVRDLFTSDHSQPLHTLFEDAQRAGTWLPLVALALLATTVLLRLRVPVLLQRCAEPLRRIRSDRYRYTLQALGLTVLAALPLPLLLFMLGRVLQHAPRNDLVGDSLGIAASTLAIPAFALAFLRCLTLDGGLAHQHFRWLRARREALRAMVPTLALAIMLPQFLHTLLVLLGTHQADATIGRALLMLGAAGVGLIAWRVMRPGSVWGQRGATQTEPVRARQFARAALAGFFALLVVLAASGYFFTALTLGDRALQSLIALLGIAVLHGLAVRWLMLGERRLALKRLEERRAEQQRAAQADARELEVATEELPEVEVDEVTVASLGAQTRHILRAAVAILFGALLLVIWSDVAPALSFLDNIALWQSSQIADGKEVVVDVTLRAVLLAILVLAMTWVATRNLPGLLEIGVLRRLRVDAPTRYAITSVVRYLIVVLGTLSGIGLLGMRWANLQWLAAGLTVGLGFGLQEIFANFISGLIVLFERPIRIGDVITVGTVEGTVARIRTRATTIVDWDNKEVVVPNKTFITERLVNWTLSDATTRIVIKLGVAYASDPVQVQRLLLEIAAAHPQVLDDPAPNCWMMGFGASTLDFELRVFVAEIGQRNPVRTELQMRIARVFAECGIEIAFPQLDVRLHRRTAATAAAAGAISDPRSS